MTPLVNVALGFFLLGERPRRAQWIALALAASGVVWLTVSAGTLPWIGLALALSFGAYGLLRKVAVLGAAGGIGQPLGLLMKVRNKVERAARA